MPTTRGQGEAGEHAVEHGRVPELEPVALEEEDDLEAFAIERREPEEREAPPDPRTGAVLEERLLPFAVHRNPAGPVDLVEEPVHHEQQDENRDEPGGGLNVEGGHALGQAVEDADGNQPGNQRGDDRQAGADANRTLERTALADHVRRDRGEHEDALEAFAEHQDGDIEHARAQLPVDRGVGEPAGVQDLQDQDGSDRRRSEGQRNGGEGRAGDCGHSIYD